MVVSPDGENWALAGLRADTWAPPAGADPYEVVTQRFRAAERFLPFTFQERAPFKCDAAHSLASTHTHPSALGVDVAECFDFCAGSADCACVARQQREDRIEWRHEMGWM